MNEQAMLNLIRLPARLTVEQAATLLGFTVLEIPILMKARLLKPLGDPAPIGRKCFSTADNTMDVERMF